MTSGTELILIAVHRRCRPAWSAAVEGEDEPLMLLRNDGEPGKSVDAWTRGAGERTGSSETRVAAILSDTRHDVIACSFNRRKTYGPVRVYAGQFKTIR